MADDPMTPRRGIDPPTQSRVPVVFEHDGQLLIRWPDPRPASFEISSELFESLIDQLNEARSDAE